MKNFISLYDNALSNEECKFIIDYFENVPPCQGIKEDRKNMSVMRDILHGSFMCQKPGVIIGSDTSNQTHVDKKMKDSTDVAMSFTFVP